MSTDLRLSPEQVQAGLASLPEWSHGEGALRRRYRTDGWRTTLLVVNAIAYICEAADHHADLGVSWPSVDVALSTHSAGGVTAKDLEVATLIERHLTWHPPPGSSLKGPARPLIE